MKEDELQMQAVCSLSTEQEGTILRMFDKPSLKPGQRALVAAALAGRSSLGVLPTGYGKSLCYQAAAVLMGGTSVVVSPLLALMRDQVDSLRQKGVQAQRYDSSLDEVGRANVLRSLSSGEVRLLFVAPETLENPSLLAALEGCKRGLFVVDEAHCVSEWGHSFRPDYLNLPTWRKTHDFRCVMALTATATLRVQRDLCEAFGIDKTDIVALSPRCPHISRRVVSTERRGDILRDFLHQPEHLPAIVYVRSRQGGEELAATLKQAGVPGVVCYHAGLSSELRARLQEDFLYNRCRVLVATIAFGMGIDKPDVRAVVHYDAPTSPESYLQESGRAGRDGAPAESLVLLSGEDLLTAHNRLLAAEPDVEGVLQCVRWLLPAGRRMVSFWELSRTCDIPEEVVKRILLELLRIGAVEVVSRGYKYYTVRPLFPIGTILDGREPGESARLEWLDGHREGEVEEAASAWGADIEEALQQLRECEASGEWKVELRQRSVCVRTLTSVSAREVAEHLSSAYARRREADLERMEHLLQILCGERCISAALDNYFTGQGGEPCGQCSVCRGSRADVPPSPSLSALAHAPAHSFAHDLTHDVAPPSTRDLKPPFARTPVHDQSVGAAMPDFSRGNQRRRFLLGISSPALMARRLWSHPLYGSARGTRWEEL